MRYTQIRSFHAVASTGSFTSAAKELNVSQPTITMQVRDLEETYGIDVFNRSHRNARLTAVGRSLFEITQRLFGVVDETEMFLSAARDDGAGQLRLSAVEPVFLIETLTAFRSHYTGIKISVSTANSATTLKHLLNYESDVGLLSDHDPDHRLFTRFHDSHAVVAIVNQDHPWADREGIHLNEIEAQPMVLRETGSNTRRAFELAASKAGVVPNVVLEIGGGEAVREAVAEGHGIGIYGEKALPKDPRLKRLQFLDVDIRLNRYLACLHERRKESLVEAFFKIAYPGQ